MPDMPSPDAIAVGKQLVELCNQGKFQEAQSALYANNIVSVEAMAGDDMPREIQGIDAVTQKSEWWEANHEVHNCSVEGPFPNGDRFCAVFNLDVTPKVGPAAGNRIQMREVAMYTVQNSKVVREEFFYGED